MRRYYWAAKAVTQLNQILLLNIEERLNPSTHTPRPITPRFNEKAGMLDVVSDDLYQREPHAILETFLVYQTTVGVNWYWNKFAKVQFNWIRSMPDYIGYGAAPFDIYGTRFQIEF